MKTGKSSKQNFLIDDSDEIKKPSEKIRRFFVPAEGFKPPTLGAEIRCAIQLRHAG